MFTLKKISNQQPKITPKGTIKKQKPKPKSSKRKEIKR